MGRLPILIGLAAGRWKLAGLTLLVDSWTLDLLVSRFTWYREKTPDSAPSYRCGKIFSFWSELESWHLYKVIGSTFSSLSLLLPMLVLGNSE